MEQISNQDLRSVLNCVETLQELCVLPDLPSLMVNLVSPIVNSEASSCSSFVDRCNILAATTPELYSFHPRPGYFQENPLIVHYAQTGDCNAYKISDFLKEQEIFRRESLHDAYQQCGVADQLAIVIPNPVDSGNTNLSYRDSRSFDNLQSPRNESTLGNLSLGFHRSDLSFSERDRTILNLLRPHIAYAYRNAQIYTKLQHQIEQFSQALDDLGSVILTPAGRIQFISPRALQLLNQYFPNLLGFGDRLPETLQSWVAAKIQQKQKKSLNHLDVPLKIEQSGKSLTIQLLGGLAQGQFVLVLDESNHQSFSIESLRLIGLTQRESEILFWVAQGKTNAEIATVLTLSEKTIKKHLENIFKKLNVQTRAAAVMSALNLLGRLDQSY